MRDAQRVLGMEPRDDSQLTYKYAIGEVAAESPLALAYELQAVDRVYMETPYAAIVQDVMRTFASWIHDEYDIPWNETWRIVRAYVPTMTKLHCVRCYTGWWKPDGGQTAPPCRDSG